jgi:hypothetical protein
MQDLDQDEQQMLPKGVRNPDGHESYLYQQAGIREYHGRIPIWLMLVALGLMAWGIYYTIRYWSAD